MGKAKYQLGAYTDVELLLEGCSAIRNAMHLAPCPDVQGWLSVCLQALEKNESAEQCLFTSYEGYRKRWGVEHHLTRRAATRLVSLFEAIGSPEKAGPYRGVPANTTNSAPPTSTQR